LLELHLFAADWRVAVSALVARLGASPASRTSRSLALIDRQLAIQRATDAARFQLAHARLADLAALGAQAQNTVCEVALHQRAHTMIAPHAADSFDLVTRAVAACSLGIIQSWGRGF
jgi:hypothetical protein